MNGDIEKNILKLNIVFWLNFGDMSHKIIIYFASAIFHSLTMPGIPGPILHVEPPHVLGATIGFSRIQTGDLVSWVRGWSVGGCTDGQGQNWDIALLSVLS